MAVIKRALIIAAGNGSRLQSKSGQLPKPLTPVCGVPLIKRLLINCERAGIESCVIVIGYQGQLLKRTIEADRSIRLSIDWIENDEWERANGLSVFKARDVLKEDFVLLMSDHLFDLKTLARLLRRRPSPGEVILAVDRKVHQVYDIDDATKVLLNGTRILKIGKGLDKYNAVDTGMFLCSPDLFDVLEKSIAKDQCSLSDGMNQLIAQGKLRFFDVKEGWWMDVDTPTALRHSEKVLIERLRKPSDGFFTRYLNRPIAMRLTRFFTNTPLSPNHVTLANLLIGFLAAGLFAKGSYWSVLLGAIFFQLGTVLGLCDGALAKIKLQDSRRGQFWHTLVENLTFVAFLVGVMIGFYSHEGAPYVLIVGVLTVFDTILALHVFHSLARRTGNWSISRIQDMIYSSGGNQVFQPTGVYRLFSGTKFAIRRDFVALLTLLLAVSGNLGLIFWAAFFATHLMALAMLYGQSRYLALPRHPSKQNL